MECSCCLQSKRLLDTQLETLRTQNQGLERDVKRFELRERLLGVVTTLCTFTRHIFWVCCAHPLYHVWNKS